MITLNSRVIKVPNSNLFLIKSNEIRISFIQAFFPFSDKIAGNALKRKIPFLEQSVPYEIPLQKVLQVYSNNPILDLNAQIPLRLLRNIIFLR